VCGVRFQLLTKGALTALVADAVARRARLVVGNHNLHSVHLYHQQPAMRRFFEMADVVHIDGMPLVWLARAAGIPAERRHRISYLDWIDDLLTAAHEGGWRVFFLGGHPSVGAGAAAVLGRRYPRMAFAYHHGFFGAGDGETVLEGIRDFKPDLLFVGMGMPRQEEWIYANGASLQGMTILPCGACFDYLTGAARTPPRWLGQLGLEWLFRLYCEPSRLWRRYLLEPLQLTATLIGKAMRGSASASS
jgi:N-acetylglucosaminyldiphosphoundecaprenol N-acetyl-beta-D-mannosaminyltransferase